MKILHLTSHLNSGGITTYLFNLSQGLLERGHQVTIISSGGSWQKNFENLGIQHVTSEAFDIKSELHPRLWQFLPKLRSFVKENSIDVLHAHKRVTQVLAQTVSVLECVPYISTCHGFYKLRLGRRIFPAWGSRVIAISKQVAEYLKNDCGVSAEKITTIPNALRPEFAQNPVSTEERDTVRKAYGLKPDSIVIGTTGRLVKVKGCDELLCAAKLLSEFHENIQVLIVGEGDQRAELFDLKNQLLLDGKVSILGEMKDIRPALQAMDIFVAPVSWEEGFGYSVLEAMHYGKPVIASNAGGLPCLVEDGVTGFLIPPGNRAGLVKALQTLVSGFALRKKMGEAGIRKARNEFSWNSMVSETEKIYERAKEAYETAKSQTNNGSFRCVAHDPVRL